MSQETPPSSQTPSLPTSANLRPYSCILCKTRKVKCDRVNPCSNCRRAGVDCIFRAPAPPRRKKRSEKEGGRRREVSVGRGMQARLRKYEGLLRGMGVRVDGLDVDESRRERSTSAMTSAMQDVVMENGKGDEHKRAETGRLVSEQGRSRYLENNLWMSLSDELHDPREILQESSEGEDAAEESIEIPSFGHSPGGDDLILGFYSPNIGLRVLHPDPIHILRLWQVFVENVDPLTKLFHTPTVQKDVFAASSNLDSVSKNMEALMFAIYSIAVISMSDEECLNMIGQTKAVLQAKNLFATKQALLNAEFIKSSDLVILQAYALFLLSVRQSFDHGSMWTLTGIAIRMGQRIGLHRDGASLGLPPFEVEMRRRLWWQILLLDGRAAELAGSGVSVLNNLSDTKPPLNVNDSELHPDMRDPPMEHERPTEMLFCAMRYEVGKFLMSSKFTDAFDGHWQSLSATAVTIAEKHKAIDGLEELLQQKFVKNCDLSIPLHELASAVAQAAICRMRLTVHHPRQYAARGMHIPQMDRDMLFRNSLLIMEFYNIGHSKKALQKFLWHVDNHFQWHSLIYLLSELSCRFTGAEVDKAWRQLEGIFEHHSQIINDTKKSLHVAICTLALRAYESRQAYMSRHNFAQGSPPRFISSLYSRKSSRKASSGLPSPSNDNSVINDYTSGVTQPTDQQMGNDGPPSDFNNMFDPTFLTDPLVLDPSAINWAEWDNLVQGFQWETPEGISI